MTEYTPDKWARHLDLCSGIGGFALGFEWAGLSKPVMFCDTEKWCRKVLAKHWPDVPIEEDVKVLANEPERIPDFNILTAGYPCQPFSLAGQRRGEEDDRHIWPYISKIIAHKRPTWCVFENVYGHVSMGLDEVLLDLESQGYATRPFIVPACGVDAPHKRDRIWIIARLVADTPSEGSRQRAVGQMGKEVAEEKRRGHKSSICSEARGSDVAYADSQRQRGQRPQGNASNQKTNGEGQASQPVNGGVGGFWLPEPAVGRVANGIPRRVDRLRGLGNAIVPQIAMKIGLTIKALDND